MTIYVFSGHSKTSSCSSIILHGEAFCLLSNFYGSVQFYTSPEVYTIIGTVSKEMLDNTSSKMVLSSIHLDFQPVAPSYIFQIFLRIAIQNQIRVAQRVIVDEIIQF